MVNRDINFSLWLDFVERDYLKNEFSSLIEKGIINGATSNPSIFANAITTSPAYKDQLASLDGKTPKEKYEALAIEDIRTAAQALHDVYDAGNDGYISIEVDPFLSNDTQATIEEGKSLMIMEFPQDIKKDEDIESMFVIIKEAITSLRRVKVIIDMGNSKIPKAYIKLDKNIDIEVAKPFIQRLAKVENIEFVDTKVKNSITDVSDNLEVYLPTSEIDMTPIINKLTKQKEKLEKEIQKLTNMLSNEKFIANARQEVIEVNKKGLEEASNKLVKIELELSALV